MTSLVLYISLIFGTFVNSQHSPLDVIPQLPDYIIPIHYNINLSLETIEKGFFNGTCDIRIRIDWLTNEISLHAQRSHIKIHSIVLDRVNSSFSIEPWYFWSFGEYDILTIFHDNVISLGYYDLKIDFMTMLNKDEKNLFKISYSNKEESKVWSIGTHFNTTGARRIFPCWDEPRFNATFNISIKHLSEHTVLSNIPEKMIYAQHNLTWIQFNETPLIPSYFVEIVVFNFRILKSIIFQCRQQAALHLKYAEMFIENVITLHLKSQWQFCKMPAKIVHIAIPDTIYQDVMHKLDFVLYRESALIYDEELESLIRIIDVARFVGRAVAIHQCFHYLDSPISWSHSWLHEGILTLYTAHAIHKIYPEFRIWDLFVVQIQQESLRLDTYSIMKPLMSEASNTEFNLLLSFTYYIKAPAILRMFQNAVGYDVFWKGIEMFFSPEIIRRSFNFDDLWTAMQIVLDNSNNTYKFNIKNLIKPWTQINYYPVVNVKQFNRSHIRISNEDASNQMIEVPITYTTQHNFNFINLLPPVKLSPFDMYYDISLPSDSDEWVIVNLQQTGYYRVKYDVICWSRIIDSTINEYTKIHVLNRAQIIDDAFYFLRNGQVSLSTFMNLTKYLQNETDYIAWYPMIKALEHVSGFFFFEPNALFKIHMRNIFHRFLNNTANIEKSDDFIECLTEEAAKWACILDDFICKYTAMVKLEVHLNDDERFLPRWKKWTYCNGLMNNDILWWRVFHKWINTSDIKLLEYLSCSASPDIIRNYLNIIVNKSENCGPKMIDCKDVRMQSNDRINSFLLTVARHAKNNEVLEYILRNFEKITPREVNIRVALIIIINHVQSREQLNMVNEATVRIRNYINVPIRIMREKIYVRFLEILNQKKYFRYLIV